MWLAWAYLFLFSKNLYDDTFLKVGSENLEKLMLGLKKKNRKQTKQKNTKRKTQENKNIKNLSYRLK